MRRLIITVSLMVSAYLHASVVQAEGIAISSGWARASIGAASNSAAYLTLTTDGETSDRLIAAETPVAERTELHDHLMEDGIARMRPVEAIDIVPGEAVVLQPGGLHIMLMGLTDKLEPGTMVPLTLSFEKAGKISIEVPVQPIGHRPNAHKHNDS